LLLSGSDTTKPQKGLCLDYLLLSLLSTADRLLLPVDFFADSTALADVPVFLASYFSSCGCSDTELLSTFVPFVAIVNNYGFEVPGFVGVFGGIIFPSLDDLVLLEDLVPDLLIELFDPFFERLVFIFVS